MYIYMLECTCVYPQGEWGKCPGLKWIFSDRPTYLSHQKGGTRLELLPGLPTYLESRGYHFTIYMSHQI